MNSSGTNKRKRSHVCIGERYGRWTVIDDTGKRANGTHRLMLCRCDCGIEKEVRARHLTDGKSQSCGCLRRDKEYAASLDAGYVPGARFGHLTILVNDNSLFDMQGSRLLPCICDCGNETLKRVDHLRNGHVSCGCLRYRKGQDNPAWKGGKSSDGRGYIRVLTPNHPNADKNGYVLEHRLVIEQQIGRYLLPSETVHHKNGIRDDNRPENLELRVGQHGSGQAVDDLVEHALSILRQYAPEHLAETPWAISA